MSDLAMARFLADKAIGATVVVQAEHLQLNAEQFDSAAQGWFAGNGGPGFRVVGGHVEQQSGKRMYDAVNVQRTR